MVTGDGGLKDEARIRGKAEHTIKEVFGFSVLQASEVSGPSDSWAEIEPIISLEFSKESAYGSKAHSETFPGGFF